MAGEKKIERVTVIGAGTMGPGIAEIMALSGADVILYARKEEKLKLAYSVIRTGLGVFAEEGTISKDEIEDVLAKVTFTSDFERAMADPDLVIEAVTEDREIKTKLYETLDGILKEDTIIASNTSFLNIFKLMPERRLSHTVITHWYSPPDVIPLVEVVPSEQTLSEVMDRVVELLRQGGKMPVRMKKYIPGYIVNRIQACVNNEVFFLLDNGYCTPEELDTAVKSSFIPRAMVLGLVQRMDFGGLNMTFRNMKNKSYTPPEPIDMPKILAEKVEKGELGVRSGKGFYDYSGRDITEIYAKRDKQLAKAFLLEKEFMSDPL